MQERHEPNACFTYGCVQHKSYWYNMRDRFTFGWGIQLCHGCRDDNTNQLYYLVPPATGVFCDRCSTVQITRNNERNSRTQQQEIYEDYVEEDEFSDFA